MFEILVPPEALEDLRWFRKADQQTILAEIEKRLRDQPQVEDRNRKPLRPGHVSEWELRIGDARVFYDVDLESQIVVVAAIGYKERSKLYFRGEEYKP